MSFELEKLENLQKQVEFYLSDLNLKKDKFFHELITSSQEVKNLLIQGYLHLDYIKKCNKVKQFEATDEELISAIKKSSDIEINSSNDSVRRTGNKALPTLEGGNKKVKTSTGDKVEANPENGSSEKKEEGKLDFEGYEP